MAMCQWVGLGWDVILQGSIFAPLADHLTQELPGNGRHFRPTTFLLLVEVQHG